MLRNGFGTLGTVEAGIVIAELFIVGILILRLAVHLFRYGSIKYGKKLSIAVTFRRKKLARQVSPFLVVPIIAVALWLGHASLHAVGKLSDYPYTRWALFGGLAVCVLVLALLGVQASNAVPAEWRDDASGGLVEFVLALETMLVLLALALLEVIHIAVAQTIENT